MGLTLVRVNRIGLTSGCLKLRQDDGLSDLARKFNLTLEAIALQTRHIVDEMNAKGHAIRFLCMSGGQAKNLPLMTLFANTCKIPVILPANSGAAVVLGAAMLGRFAADFNGNADKQGQGSKLWDIMVNAHPFLMMSRLTIHPSG